MRRIAILDAPSNLGLRPPTETSVPGCAKAPGALRDHDLVARLAARDAGCLTPPRYDPGDWRPGDGVCHAQQIAAYSAALADRIGSIIDAGEFPVVLGGDCSILLGSALAMHRLGEVVGGRVGLVFVDGHSDFRHPGNASYVGAAAGEDLALATGRGQADLAGIEGRRPYFRDVDVVVLGIRAQDEYRLDLQAAGIITRPVPALRVEGAARTAQWARDQLSDCAGYWVHVDVDVLDPAVMPAVDAPDPGGIAFAELELLLSGLVDTPHCLGVEITVFDPDYDPDGSYAAEIVETVVAGLAPLRMAPVGAGPSTVEAGPPPSSGPSSSSGAGPGSSSGAGASEAGLGTESGPSFEAGSESGSSLEVGSESGSSFEAGGESGPSFGSGAESEARPAGVAEPGLDGAVPAEALGSAAASVSAADGVSPTGGASSVPVARMPLAPDLAAQRVSEAGVVAGAGIRVVDADPRVVEPRVAGPRVAGVGLRVTAGAEAGGTVGSGGQDTERSPGEGGEAGPGSSPPTKTEPVPGPRVAVEAEPDGPVPASASPAPEKASSDARAGAAPKADAGSGSRAAKVPSPRGKAGSKSRARAKTDSAPAPRGSSSRAKGEPERGSRGKAATARPAKSEPDSSLRKKAESAWMDVAADLAARRGTPAERAERRSTDAGPAGPRRTAGSGAEQDTDPRPGSLRRDAGEDGDVRPGGLRRGVDRDGALGPGGLRRGVDWDGALGPGGLRPAVDRDGALGSGGLRPGVDRDGAVGPGGLRRDGGVGPGGLSEGADSGVTGLRRDADSGPAGAGPGPVEPGSMPAAGRLRRGGPSEAAWKDDDGKPSAREEEPVDGDGPAHADGEAWSGVRDGGELVEENSDGEVPVPAFEPFGPPAKAGPGRLRRPKKATPPAEIA